MKLKRPARTYPLSACLGHGDLAASLLYTFPVFLLYGVGVVFSPAMNGVDFLSRNLYAAVGYDKLTYLLVHLALAVLFAATVYWMRKKGGMPRGKFVPMLLESGIYALTIGSLILFLMHRVLRMDPSLAASGLGSDPITGIILSLGAGAHEELVFRLGLFAGGAALLRVTTGMRHGAAIGIAMILSSAAFSAVHHLGDMGDPWSLAVFTYRMLAGVLFACIFYWRSLAHAVYTHALYDVYVLVLS